MAGVSIREAARQLGKSDTALRKAEKRGTISFDKDGRVDVEKVRLQLQANTDPSRGGDRRIQNQAETPRGEFGAAWKNQAQNKTTAGTFQAARAAREAYEAKLSELKYRQTVGALVNAADVKRATANKARIARDALLSLPARVSAELAAEQDVGKVHDRLTAEIRKICSEIAAGEVDQTAQ